ncbi:MAG: hypothetical protein ACOZNI_22635 [Myxococcota bacterium]
MWASLLAGAAWASACCGGGGASVPMRPADCDHVVAGVGVSAQTALGRWDVDGRAVPTSSSEQDIVATIGAGYRPAHWGHLTLSMPAQVNRRAAGDTAAWGGGVGDVRVMAYGDPFEEDPEGWLPVPYLGVGVRAATGRAWDESDHPLLADVTGEAGTALVASASVERSFGRWPYGVQGDVELPVEDRLGVAPAKATALAFVGRNLGDKWTVTASVRASRTFPEDALGAGRTSAALRVVRGEKLLYRAWLGIDADLPISGLGRSFTQLGSVGAGFAIVR